MFPKRCARAMFPRTLPNASASSDACEAGKMGRPAATSSPRHKLSSFLLATRVKENFKFWLRWQSDRSWSQGKGNPPLSHSSGYSFSFVDSSCGVLWLVVCFSGTYPVQWGALAQYLASFLAQLSGCTAPVKLSRCLCSSLSKYLTFSEARVTSARSQLLLFSKLITKLLSSTVYITRPKKWSIGSS